MSQAFHSFPPASIKFLSALAKNNNREWFQPRKQEFEELLQQPMVRLAERVNAMLRKNAPEYSFPEPSKALNRIYRDVRFSADKTPYQNHLSMMFPHHCLGKKSGAALYLSLSATELMIGGGLYFGETRELQAVREYLADQYGAFASILRPKALKETFGELAGESLLKAPKQFGSDHPAADLLKRKQWLLLGRWPVRTALEEDFGSETVKKFALLLPFVKFLNVPLEKTPVKTQEPML